MTNEISPEPKKKRRWVKFLLFVSLSLNLLIAGMVAGAFFRAGHGPDPASPEIAMRGDLGLGPYGQALSRPDRRILREAMASQVPDRRKSVAQLRADMADVLIALRQRPFEIEAVRSIIATQQSRIFGSQNLSKDFFLEHLAELGDAERSAYADRLEKVMSRQRPTR